MLWLWKEPSSIQWTNTWLCPRSSSFPPSEQWTFFVHHWGKYNCSFSVWFGNERKLVRVDNNIKQQQNCHILSRPCAFNAKIDLRRKKNQIGPKIQTTNEMAKLKIMAAKTASTYRYRFDIKQNYKIISSKLGEKVIAISHRKFMCLFEQYVFALLEKTSEMRMHGVSDDVF